MNGIINLLKPPGMTSFDAVAFLRRVTGERKIGHAGTLDPCAAGVLVLACGRATKQIEILMAGEKQYYAGISFGVATDTADAEGSVTQTGGRIPPQEEIIQNMQAFIGEIEQTPPQYSAVKIKGKPAYAYARAGQEVEIKPKIVNIRDWALLWYEKNGIMTRVDCGKGVYVRSLAVDLAARMGAFAHLSYLLRTRVGEFSIENAVTCEQILALQEKGNLEQCMTLT